MISNSFNAVKRTPRSTRYVVGLRPMALRLNKPLTVRLFSVPKLKAGEMTIFENEDLCNCAVLAVP